jgi:hypothetical protein
MIARTPLYPLQVAMYQRMVGDPDLSSRVTGIFDEVPEGQQKPYVVLGEAFETPRNNHGQFGRTTVASLHIWSSHAGFSEALNIQNSIMELFDHQPLTVDGQHVVAVRYEFSQTLRDPDPDIRHVVLRFRVTTEQRALSGAETGS